MDEVIRIHSIHYPFYVRKSCDGCLNIYTEYGDIVGVGCEKFTGELTQEMTEILVKAWMDGHAYGLMDYKIPQPKRESL